MSYFLNADGKQIVERIIASIQENKVYLSDIDGLIGDGDHGINMNKGFTMCAAEIEGKDISFSEALSTLGRVLMMEIGGSMGPLYGSFFRKMGRRCKDQEKIDAALFADMMNDAVDGVAGIGHAGLGDKTLMDVLIPANDACRAAAASGAPFDRMLLDMKSAAETGWASTKDMVAKVGRASRLGERSRGTLDAGATSCNLILQAMADAIVPLLAE